MTIARRANAHLAFLLLILALAAGLRLYDLSGVPSELIADELDLYNSAQSIASTGHDIDGTLLPFFYSRFTRNPPLYGVAAYASSRVFGKNAVALRLPAALFGVAAVMLIYGIGLELSGRREVALAAALLAATQPILVHFSRIAWEPASQLPFIVGGLYVVLRCLKRADEANEPLALGPLILAGALLGLASFTYMAAWVYSVLLAGALLLLNFRRLTERITRWNVGAGIGMWLLVSAPALWMWFGDPLTYGRTHRISTFGNGISLAALATFFANYAKQFDWSYLATTGDPIPGATWRYLVGFGAFFWWVVPLTGAGLALLPRVVPALWARRWLWIWLLVYPLGAALTNEAIPNAPRTLAGVPVFCLLGAIGFTGVLDLARRARKHSEILTAIVQGLFVAGTLASTALFARYYFTEYVRVYPNAWDSGTRDLFALVHTKASHYDRICFTLYPAFYAVDTYVRFYLSDVATPVIEDANDPACYLPGTLLVTDTTQPRSRAHFAPIATVRDIDGLPFADVSGRPRGPS